MIDPQDKLAALEWAVALAAERQSDLDPVASLNLHHLQQMRDEARREARR